MPSAWRMSRNPVPATDPQPIFAESTPSAIIEEFPPRICNAIPPSGAQSNCLGQKPQETPAQTRKNSPFSGFSLIALKINMLRRKCSFCPLKTKDLRISGFQHFQKTKELPHPIPANRQGTLGDLLSLRFRKTQPASDSQHQSHPR
ncbi:MAG: hypothetical protein ABSG96_10010 [Terracidiphilus sp.]